MVTLQCQTINGTNTPGIRLANVTNTGFQWRINELVVTNPADNQAGLPQGTYAISDGTHKKENVGWVAFGF